MTSDRAASLRRGSFAASSAGLEPELEDLRVQLAICNLICLARLGFDDRVREIFGGATMFRTRLPAR